MLTTLDILYLVSPLIKWNVSGELVKFFPFCASVNTHMLKTIFFVIKSSVHIENERDQLL